MTDVRYYSEKELTKIIREAPNSEILFKSYFTHKFTYTTKNLVHTLTKYNDLIKINIGKKISKKDRRLMTLIMSLNSHTNMLSNTEKTIVCNIQFKNIKDDI